MPIRSTSQRSGAGPAPTPLRDFAGNGRSGALLYDPNLGQPYTALSNANGTYQYVPNLFTAHFDTLLTGDYNGDGKTDLIVYNSQTALAYIGMSNGSQTGDIVSLFATGEGQTTPAGVDGKLAAVPLPQPGSSSQLPSVGRMRRSCTPGARPGQWQV